ncbi:response regulator transcription factor [Billgrantia azerbaijanica]|nr:response regulator transcription factor [Halomonas azerbaijanica]
MKLLLLEDDDLLAESLAETLGDEGYRVDTATHIRVAESLMQTEEYGLVILDLGLPDGSGLDLLERWRGSGYKQPILALTARDTWEDKVVGLRCGADDYLTKPFYGDELLARLHALLRRQHGNTGNVLTVHGIHLDEHLQEVSTDGTTWQSLTATEFRLLRFLMHHPNRVHSKLRLLAFHQQVVAEWSGPSAP